MGQTQTIARLLSHSKWRGQEVAHLILSAAEDLGCGREPLVTEAEAATLRKGLSPDEWREYARSVTGWAFIQDHLWPAGQIALLEATRGLLAAEVLLTRVLDLAVYRPTDVDAVAAWSPLVRALLTDLQLYVAARARTLVWLAAGTDAFMSALGLTTLPSRALLKELMAELEAAVAHAMQLITLLKAIDVDVPALSIPENLGPDDAAICELEHRMHPQKSSSWAVLWAWWLARGEEPRDVRASGE
jgi:hypothetical protein